MRYFIVAYFHANGESTGRVLGAKSYASGKEAAGQFDRITDEMLEQHFVDTDEGCDLRVVSGDVLDIEDAQWLADSLS